MATDEYKIQSLEQQLALNQAHLKKLEADFAAEVEANRAAVVQLKSTLAIKAEFMAQVNHELRTPLNGMLPMIELILRSDLSAETREYVLTLRQAGLSLLSIINDVLDFSKIEAGRLEVASVKFDLAETVEGVAQILAPAAASKNILLLSTIDKNLPETLIGDPQKIRQVLLNLCGNAIKFTEKGVVNLKVSSVKSATEPRQLLFTVTDSGPGISGELMSHLFEPFFQGPFAKQNDTPGTGLGLSISKRLVELMSGKMFVESTLSVGSTFGFYLPQDEPVNQEILRVWSSPQISPSALTRNQEKAAPFTANLLVLTLEPIHNGRSAIADLLKTFELNARSCQSAQTAYAILAAMATVDATHRPAMTVLFLDTVRMKDECLRLRSMLNDSALVHSVKLVEIVAQDNILPASKSSHEEEEEEEVLTVPMPMRRQAVNNCLRAHSVI